MLPGRAVVIGDAATHRKAYEQAASVALKDLAAELGGSKRLNLADAFAQIDAIEGISASVTSLGEVSIVSDSPTSQFTFGEDSSSFLAAIGLNTFFQGTGATDIAVNQTLLDNSNLLEISSGGIGAETDILTEMVDLVDRPLDNLDGRTVRGTYDQTIAKLAQQINLHQSSSEGLSNFYATLQSQHLAISGVNIDEESIRMITYQRAFQASARVISTANEMLDILMSL